jgi:hypothetical protein
MFLKKFPYCIILFTDCVNYYEVYYINPKFGPGNEISIPVRFDPVVWASFRDAKMIHILELSLWIHCWRDWSPSSTKIHRNVFHTISTLQDFRGKRGAKLVIGQSKFCILVVKKKILSLLRDWNRTQFTYRTFTSTFILCRPSEITPYSKVYYDLSILSWSPEKLGYPRYYLQCAHDRPPENLVLKTYTLWTEISSNKKRKY